MPHVVVKLYPGKSDAQKTQLADAIVRDVMQFLGHDESAVSVGFEEIAPAQWAEKVYRSDIQAHPERIYKEPGYSM